jgi:hypothetical protein
MKMNETFDEATAKPVTAELLEKQIEQLEKHRGEDALSSAESSWMQHAAQLEDAEKGKFVERIQSGLKGLGMAGQALTVVMDEKMQRKMAPTIKFMQLSTTAMGGVLSAVFGVNAKATKMDFLKAQTEKYADKIEQATGEKRTLEDLHNRM